MYKNRLIIIPQFPAKLRYQSWWLEEFKTEFSKFFKEVIIFGFNIKDNDGVHDFLFSDIEKSILFENEIIKDYMSFDLKPDDILLLNDISFPGLFPHVLFHKKPKKCFAICHATSINNLDYYQNIKCIKWPIEKSISNLFNKIFVATKYHKEKLLWNNSYVVGLPCHSRLKNNIYINNYKKNKIISVSRGNPQKTNIEIENFIEDNFSEIKKEKFNSWEKYYKFLSESKILLSTAREETFGYCILDAIYNKCIPIAPNNFSYPELLDKKYLYNNKEELLEKLKSIEKGEIETPKYLLNQNLIDNFYKNISFLMGE